MGLGVVELIILLVMGLIFLAIPTVTLVLAFLIYSKLDRIERAVSQKD